jgi:putative tricarboxylic transport membrane protein
MMDWNAVITVLSPSMLLIIAVGVFGGIIMGALPGLTATMGVALLVPLTFGMNPIAGLSMLMGIYVGAIYGGCISAILLKTPGTPASAATTLDGYPMAQNGHAGKALGMATLASGIGGLVSAAILIGMAPQLAKLALMFGPAEYFALAIFGLTIIASLSTDILKGLLIGFLGMLLSTVGNDPVSGFTRFTFGVSNLANGIAFIPALIGLFAISEVLTQLDKLYSEKVETKKFSGLFPTREEWKTCWKTLCRGSIIGTVIGIIPGTGTNIAAWLSYNEARRASKTPEKFGTGYIEGVAATESANNAVCGGALIPLLTLGIPGDSVTAVFLGGLIIHGLAPGPRLFLDHPDIVSGLFTGIIIANIFMIFLGLVAVKFSAKLLNIPKRLLLTAILIFCFIGSYSINQNPLDIVTMLCFGVIGYLCQRYNYSQSALCIAMILGPIAEQNMRLALMSSDMSPMIFFTRPISLLFMTLAILSFVWPVWKAMKKLARAQAR